MPIAVKISLPGINQFARVGRIALLQHERNTRVSFYKLLDQVRQDISGLGMGRTDDKCSLTTRSEFFHQRFHGTYVGRYPPRNREQLFTGIGKPDNSVPRANENTNPSFLKLLNLPTDTGLRRIEREGGR